MALIQHVSGIPNRIGFIITEKKNLHCSINKRQNLKFPKVK